MNINPNQNQQNQQNQQNKQNRPLNRSVRDVAIEIDDRLKYVSLYAQTQGLTKEMNMEEMRNKFLEYRGMLKRGTFTITELEEDVFLRYGPFEDSIKSQALNPNELNGVVFGKPIEVDIPPTF